MRVRCLVTDSLFLCVCGGKLMSIHVVMPGLSCRFYQHRFPEVEDVVMVNVRSIAEMGAYVSLLEYNNIEGMILLSELSRRRIRSINKLIRIGRNECVVVIRVDKEKGEGMLLCRPSDISASCNMSIIVLLVLLTNSSHLSLCARHRLH